MGRLKSERPTGLNGRPPIGEAEVVLLDELCPILKKWVDEWRATTDTNGALGGYWDTDITAASPLNYLEEFTGIPVRKISAIVNNDRRMYIGGFINLGVADKLLQAADLQGNLGRTIHVIPNPTWSLHKWIDYMKDKGSCEG